MNDGVHIRAVMKHQPGVSDGPCLLEIHIYPLPQDRELLNACYAAARDAVKAELEKHGLCSDQMTEIPPAGDMSKKH